MIFNQDACFIHFSQSIEGISLPEKFTFPFYYQPHQLCVIAAQELQQHLKDQQTWQHNFGLESANDTGIAIGKMFGVLIVRNQEGDLGYLTAFSGKLADQNILPPFVPPVFDMLTQDSFFRLENVAINQINHQIEQLEANPEIATLEARLNDVKAQTQTELEVHRQLMVDSRKQRKLQRQQGEASLSAEDFTTLSIELSRQSVQHKHQLAALKRSCDDKLSAAQHSLNQVLQPVAQLKSERKKQSNALQHKLFSEYRFLNSNGIERNLNDIFREAPNHLPPAGAGECAAPKLLNYAFKYGLTPIAMAEFWWGTSPKSEIKQHKNFYPACHGKCRPILGHMLQGMEVDADPLLKNPAEGKEIEVIYQDDQLAIINKPSEFLSVAGKNITDSVHSRMRLAFPNATGPLIVHRLDMSTSGLMVIALTKEANKALQQQFIHRTVSKRYVAMVEGSPAEEQGEIILPLRVDLDDRPKQLVCYEHGKAAVTHWQVKQRLQGKTLLNLYPQTGRTHQLRVHCAHHLGLNTPIIGDDLYGKQANRLHLHAEYLAFRHPETNERMEFEVAADFETEKVSKEKY